jgi:hypothetical protein
MGFTMKKEPQYTYTQIELPPWKLRGDSPEEKERFREKQRKEEISRKGQEKMDKHKELERLRIQIEQQKKDRKGTKTEVTEEKKVDPTPKKNKEYTHTTIQCRLPNGSHCTLTLNIQDTFHEVHAQLIKKGDLQHQDSIVFCIPYLKKEYQMNTFHTLLSQAGLVPTGTITVLLASQKGIVIKGEGNPVVLDDETDE